MRELRSELITLINSGHCGQCSAFDITLTDGTILKFAKIEIFVDRFGISATYLAKIASVTPLDMSLEPASDETEFSVANVDMIMGQSLTGAIRKLDGARCIIGTIFIDKQLDFDDGAHIYDSRLSGELVDGDVSDQEVSFIVISDLDVVTVPGSLIASEFQWREPVSNVPVSNPNDLNPRGFPGPVGDEDFPGRYPEGRWYPGMDRL